MIVLACMFLQTSHSASCQEQFMYMMRFKREAAWLGEGPWLAGLSSCSCIDLVGLSSGVSRAGPACPRCSSCQNCVLQSHIFDCPASSFPSVSRHYIRCVHTVSIFSHIGLVFNMKHFTSRLNMLLIVWMIKTMLSLKLLVQHRYSHKKPTQNHMLQVRHIFRTPWLIYPSTHLHLGDSVA